MAEQFTVGVYLKPHIRRYLLKKLGVGMGDTPHALDVARDLAEMLPLRLCAAVENKSDGKARQRLVLSIRTSDLPDIDPKTANQVWRYAEKLYAQEFRNHVELWTRTGLTNTREAIKAFREKYGITEEDQPLEVAERVWRRVRMRATGERRPHGGPRRFKRTKKARG